MPNQYTAYEVEHVLWPALREKGVRVSLHGLLTIVRELGLMRPE